MQHRGVWGAALALLLCQVLAIVLAIDPETDRKEGHCQRERDAIAKMGERLNGVLMHTEHSLGMHGGGAGLPGHGFAPKTLAMQRLLSPEGPSGDGDQDTNAEVISERHPPSPTRNPSRSD